MREERLFYAEVVMNGSFRERFVVSVLILLLILIAGLLEPKSLVGAISVALIMLGRVWSRSGKQGTGIEK